MEIIIWISKKSKELQKSFEILFLTEATYVVGVCEDAGSSTRTAGPRCGMWHRRECLSNGSGEKNVNYKLSTSTWFSKKRNV